MRRFAVAALAALLAAAGLAQSAGAAPMGRWSMAPTRGDDPSRVQLRLEYSESSSGNTWNSSWSSPVAVGDAGISAERLRGPAGPVTFRIAREPGSFDCTGSAGEGSGAGQFRYEPSARFDDALASRGLSRPTFAQSLELAISSTTLAFVDQLRASSQHVTTADVVRVVQRGVDPKYIAELSAIGYHAASLDDLVRLRDHGVTAAFVGRLKAHGYANLSVKDLIRLRDAGI